MFFSHLRRGFTVFVDPLVSHFIRRGYHPDTFTILGFVVNLSAAILYGMGLFFEGGLIMLFGSTSDIIDGAIARKTHGESSGGALLDSTIDRYSEAAVFIGLIVHYSTVGWTVTVAVVAAALTGSFMVSYVRARAEGLGFECKVGMMQRPERIIFLAAVSVFGVLRGTPDGHVAVAMWFLATFTTITSIERIIHVRRLARRRDALAAGLPDPGDGPFPGEYMQRHPLLRRFLGDVPRM